MTAEAAAPATPTATEGAAEVRLVFPVEIEVRGGYDAVDVEAIVDSALKRLARGLRSA